MNAINLIINSYITSRQQFQLCKSAMIVKKIYCKINKKDCPISVFAHKKEDKN